MKSVDSEDSLELWLYGSQTGCSRKMRTVDERVNLVSSRFLKNTHATSPFNNRVRKTFCPMSFDGFHPFFSTTTLKSRKERMKRKHRRTANILFNMMASVYSYQKCIFTKKTKY